ncbi:MAG: hypothetical protein SFU85_06520 [Candidatus Methylacidiphilales bacterium]|nr:hypothetical protein [Candidatus Methylacidiphilales bacterium]
MDKEQAKLILACARPDGQDDADPAVREALAFAQNDPELRTWLEAERKQDREVVRALASLPVPQRLRADLLSQLNGREKVVTFPFWRQPQVWALAAGLLVLGAIGWMVSEPGFTRPRLLAATYTEMRKDIGTMVSTGQFKPTHEVPGTGEALAWLAEKQAPLLNDLPPFLTDARAVACSVLEWRGRKVGGMCLEKNGRLMHVFVIPRNQLNALPPDGQILRESFGGHRTLAWNSPRNFYVLIGDQTDTDVEFLLGGS